jgi:SAM-dependent methyltransferase
MSERTLELDSPARIIELRSLLRSKGFLRRFYEEVYSKYQSAVERSAQDGVQDGIIVELGSGASFIKDVIPDAVTSDVIPYPGIDQVLDATRLPFADESVRAILMMNVFHHIPDVEAFLREANRCLKPGGRVFILDQTVGWLSKIMLGKLHHEPFRPDATSWRFDSTGPLSGANGALAWIVFQRDRKRFESLFPGLRIAQYQPHSPFRYWLAGGLKAWTLLPGWSFDWVTKLEKLLSRLHPGWCCFTDIEIVKINSPSGTPDKAETPQSPE